MFFIIIVSVVFVLVLFITLSTYKKSVDKELETTRSEQEIKKFSEQIENYKAANNYQKALELSRQLIDKYPKSEKIRLIYAGLLFDIRKYNETIACLAQILKTNEKCTEAAMMLGNVYLKIRQVSKAAAVFNSVLNKNPSNVEACKRLAEVLLIKQEKNEALRLYKKIIPLIEDESEQKAIRLVVTNIYCDLRDWKNMLTEANLLMETYPEDRTILSYLKKGYIYSENYFEAIKILTKLLELEPLNPKHYEEITALYFKTGNYNKVIKFGEKSIGIPKINKPLVYNFIAKAHIEIGEKMVALDVLKDAVATFGKDVELKRALGDLYCDLENFQEAINLFKEYLEIAMPREVETIRKILSNYYFLYANYLFKKGDKDLAFSMYDTALQYDPDNVQVYIILAEINLKIKNYNEAIKYYKYTINATPQDYNNYFKLANLYYEIDNMIEANKYYREASLLKPDLVLAHAGIGLTEAKLNHPDAAIKAFNTALDLDALNVDIRYNLALAYELASSIPNAIAEYMKVLDLDPEHREAKNNIEILNKFS